MQPRKKSLFSIKLPLLFSMIMVLLISSLVIIYLNGKETLADFRQHISEIQQLQRTEVQQFIESQFNDIEMSVKIIVSQIENKQLDLKNTSALKENLKIIATQNQSIANITFADFNDNYYCIFRTEVKGELLFAQADASGVMDSYNLDHGVYTLEPDMKVTGFFATKRTWFISALNKTSIVWYPVYKMFSSDTYAVGASQAVKVNDSVVGVVAADLALIELSIMLNSLHKDRNGVVLLLDESKSIIAYNQTVDNEIYSLLTSQNMLNNIFDNKNSLMNTGDLIIQRSKMDFGKTGTFWLLNAVSEKQALKTIYSRASTMVWITAIILLLAFSMIWIILSLLLKPLNELENVSLHLAQGEWDIELPKSNLREIHNLSSAYQVMIKRIKNAMNVLEEKVKLRTAKLRELNEKLSKSNLTDEMTRLGNRRYYNERMDELWLNNDPIILAIADVDYFKLYNDTYGHIKGDECLKNLADVMLNALKNMIKNKQVEIARIGGEEFALIFTNVKRTEAIKYLKKIQQQLLEKNIEHTSSLVSDSVSLSIGIAKRQSNDVNWQLMYKKADAALYKAKEKRNCIVEL